MGDGVLEGEDKMLGRPRREGKRASPQVRSWLLEVRVVKVVWLDTRDMVLEMVWVSSGELER
jgi:hypothetical protein